MAYKILAALLLIIAGERVCMAELAVYWALDETNGIVAVDSSANAADGVYQGGYTLGVLSPELSIYGTAVDFDAAADGEVFKASWAVLNELTNDFTVAAWIKPNVVTGTVQRIFSSSSKGWGFGLSASNGLRLTTYGITDYDISAVITTGVWTHVAATISTNNDVEFFLNGTSIGSVTGTYPAEIGEGNWFVAGNGSGEHFDGAIDEVRIYNTVLSYPKISALSARVTAYWAMNETSGTVVLDSGPNAIHGAYQGSCNLGQRSPDRNRYGTAVKFDGIDGEVFKSDTPYLYGLTNSFTVMAWIKADSISGTQRIFSSAGEQWGFGLNGSNLLFTSYGIADYTATNAVVAAGAWIHVAAAFSRNNYISYYVNGTWMQTINAGQSASQSTDVNWFIASGGTGERFNGTIDEVRIYDRELLEEMVAKLAVMDPPQGFVFAVR
jgi:hypothetical protein